MSNATTLRGTPAFGAGKFGNCLTSGVLGTSGTSWDAPTATLEAWVKTSAATTLVAVGNHGTGANGWWIGLNSGGVATFGDPTSLKNTSVVINNGAWHHLALVVDATGTRFYVDGVQSATSTYTSLTMGAGTNAIGGFGANNGYDWNGAIDEVRVSKVARYTANFTPAAAAFTVDSDTLALYHLESDGADAVTPAGIAPNDAAIAYSPFNWSVSSTAAKTICPGAYFRTQFSGGACTLNFDMSGLATPYPQIKYRIDGAGWITATIAATVPLTMPTDNSWTKHTLEVVVKSTSEFVTRWSPQQAAVVLTGIVVPGLSSVTEPTMRILVFGDSITEAYKSLSNTTDVAGSDSTVGWAWQLCNTMGAQVGVVGYGGIGWLNAGQGGVPALPSNYSLLWGSGPTRSLSAPAPDVIVVNCGENDSADVTSVATSFLTTLLAATSISTKILVMRPFSGNHATELQAAVTAAASGRVSYVDTTGWFNSADSSDGQHPYGYASKAISARLANEIRAALGRGATWLNVGGAPKAASPVRR